MEICERKVKILFIVEAMGGGVFTYIVDLANELAKNNNDIYVAYSIRPQTPKDYKAYFCKNIHLIHVKNFGREINLMKDVKAFGELREIEKQINPDVIHLHSSKAGAIGRLAFNGKKVPLFYTPHGYSFLMQDHSSKKRKIYKLLELACAKRNCMTISCSEGEHLETLKLTHRAAYVNNGVNMTELQRYVKEQTDVENHTFTVCTLGRICYQKNPKLFNEIALELPEIRFKWIGDGELRDELYAPNIEIIGWIEREHALRITEQADVFLLTSLWEGLPLSLLEAMYMKKICVVSDVIGNRDVICTNENGFVCNDINDFVQAIKFSQSNDMSQITKRAYQDVIKKYNTEVMAKSYKELYMSGIDKGI